jgi:tetratricopeptide (TPR) repeat protein
MSKEKGFLEIGKRLLSVRGDMDQRGFSRLVNVSQQAISNYERGSLPASWSFLRKMREDFHVDLNWLVTGEGRREPLAGNTLVPLVDNRSPGWAQQLLQEPVFYADDPLHFLLTLYFLYLSTEPADAKARLIGDLQKISRAARGQIENEARSEEEKQMRLSVVAALERDDRPAAVAALIQLGDRLDSYEDTTIVPRLRKLFLAALTLARMQEMKEEELDSLRKVGRSYRKEGRWEEADRFYKAALTLFDVSVEGAPETAHRNNPRSVEISASARARTLLGYGQVAKHRGEIPLARDRFMTALEWALRSQEPRLRAEIYLDLGCLSIHERDWDKALEFTRAGSTFANEVGDRDLQVRLRINEALVLRKLGDVEAAETILRPMLGEARAEGHGYYVAFVSLNLAEVLVDRGRSEEAEEMLRSSSAEAQSFTDPRLLALRKLLQARLEAAKGEGEAARVLLLDCMRYAKEHGLAKEFERAARALDGTEEHVTIPSGSRAG